MTRTKLAITALMILILMLACATIGGGNDQDNSSQNTQQQNQGQNQNDNNQTEQDAQNAQNTSGDNKKDNNDEDKKPPTGGGEGALWETDFGKLLESGDLAVESIHANEDYETVGTILTIQFTNTGTDEIIVTLPCGLVFMPDDSEEQALMMVQPLEISLAAGETAEFTPYVVCIEIAAGAPALNSGYTIGHLEGGDLLAFAECVCGEQVSQEIGDMDSVGIQFAAWTVATGGDLFGAAQEDAASFQEFLDEMEAAGLGETVEEMLSMFSGEWLDRCGITIEE